MVTKLTLPSKENDVQTKINELVDGKQDVLTAGTDLEIVTAQSGNGLPNTYIELEYIKSEGDALIQTSVSGNIDTKVTLVARVDGTTTSSQVVASFGQATGANWFGRIGSTGYWGSGLSNGQYTNGMLASNKSEIVINTTNTASNSTIGGTVTQGDTTAGWSRTENRTTIENWTFMGVVRANASDNNYFTNGRLYYAKLEQGGVVVGEYIPAKRVADGVVGLYDKVTSTFLTKTYGTGNFTAGDEIIYSNENVINFTNASGYALESDILPVLNNKQDKLTAGTDLEIIQGSELLPNGYTQLECAIATGQQWFSLGISGNCTFELTAQGVANIAKSNVIVTSKSGADGGAWFGGAPTGQIWAYSNILYTTKADIVLTFDGSGLTGTVNGEAISRAATVVQEDWLVFNNYTTIYVNDRYPCSASLYRLKATQNNTLVRDLIPAKRNADGKVGFYDVVNDVFYISISGTDFVAGSEVSTGTSVINFTNSSGYTTNIGTVTSVNNTSPDGSGNVSITVGDTLPSQTGQSGKFLTTDGTSTSWGTPTASATWGSITGTLSDQTDLQNALDAKQDEATAVNYDNITNCLTEIPQDIKLELNNGTLTLKAGSKVYVPNGFESDGTTPKFDVETVESDLTSTETGAAQMYICKISGGGVFGGYMTGGTVTERPSSPVNYAVYYNTTTNICEGYWSGAWHTLSFPIAIATRGSSGYESIDQVFNGFGYVGSSVFALPGVKGLMPNGRNADGTLKNISFEVSRARTADMSNGNRTLILQNGGSLMGYLDTAYYEDENIIKNSSGQIQLVCYLGHVIVESGAITRFETKTAFHAVDYSDSPTIAGWAMPSDRYIDLTLGSSGATYTAPANGWFVLSKAVNTTQQYILFLNSTNGMRSDNYNNRNNNTIGAFLPCKKGDIVSCSYSAGGATSYFRFVYAEGENV